MATYYPPTGFHFLVEFDGLAEHDIGFQEVSGLNASIETETFQEGGENRFSHRFPKPATYQNLTLKRGMLLGSKLIDWFRKAVEEFKFQPVNVTVLLVTPSEKADPLNPKPDKPSYTTLEKWTFMNAYPVKWNIDAFNAQDNKVVAETIELCYQYFKREMATQDPPKVKAAEGPTQKGKKD